MRSCAKTLLAFGFTIAALLANSGKPDAQEHALTAIDILLDPDQTMIQRAEAVNARLRKAFPKGFALDATHRPHITVVQRYVRTTDLEKVYEAVGNVLANEKPAGWKLKAFKYYYIPSDEIGLAGIVIEPTGDLLRFQQKMLDAVAPFTVETASPAAFASNEGGRDIQQALVDYVATFVPASSGKNFNPHVTIGIATQDYLKSMLADPFEAFTFAPAGLAVYQLGSFGTAQKKLKTWELAR